MKGNPAPNCRLDGLAGRPGLNLAELRGRVVYVDFWASWCPHCGPAFRFLNSLEAELAAAGLTVLGVNLDQRRDEAERFLERHPARFALASDASGACPAAFAVTGMPSAYLLDRDGVVRGVHVGFRPGDAAGRREEISRLLEEAASGSPRP